MSSRCRFSTTWASMASASVSLTTRTGMESSSAILAARRRRAPATTSYLLGSNSRTKRGARTPCVLKLAASSSRLLSSNRFRGLLADSISAATGTLRYSWLLTAVCVFGIFFSFNFVVCRFVMDCADFWRGWGTWWVRRLRREPRARGQCPRGSRQRFAERLPNSRAGDWRLRAKLDVVLGRGSIAQPNRLADHKGHGFRFRLADLFGGEGAAFTAMQHLVRDLMDQRGEFLGGLHPGQQRDLAAVGQTLGGCNALGET